MMMHGDGGDDVGEHLAEIYELASASSAHQVAPAAAVSATFVTPNHPQFSQIGKESLGLTWFIGQADNK